MRRVRGPRQPPKLKYSNCCVDLQSNDDIAALNDMVDNAVDVTLHTMLRNCEGIREWASTHGYSSDLPLSKDPHVGFHRSKFQGARCFFLQWSGIEYIWTPNGLGNIASSYGGTRDTD